jgi:amphi-Trp domain-containing protein
MKQGKKSFRHESLQDAKSIQAILKAVSQGLGKGKLSLSDEEDEMLLEPRGLLRLKLTAQQEENRQRINLRISWQSEDEQPEKKSLKITGK